jgi:hypothetical protein
LIFQTLLRLLLQPSLQRLPPLLLRNENENLDEGEKTEVLIRDGLIPISSLLNQTFHSLCTNPSTSTGGRESRLSGLVDEGMKKEEEKSCDNKCNSILGFCGCNGREKERKRAASTLTKSKSWKG